MIGICCSIFIFIFFYSPQAVQFDQNPADSLAMIQSIHEDVALFIKVGLKFGRA